MRCGEGRAASAAAQSQFADRLGSKRTNLASNLLSTQTKLEFGLQDVVSLVKQHGKGAPQMIVDAIVRAINGGDDREADRLHLMLREAQKLVERPGAVPLPIIRQR